MLHACFKPIALCFVYTSWHFYAFSGTNLLTICHSASSYSLLFLYFRKVIQEIFSELDETKAKPPIFPTQRWSPKQRRRRAPRWPPHLVPSPLAAPSHGVGPSGALWHRPSTYNCLRRENPKSIGIHSRKVPQHRRHWRLVSRDRSLCSGTLPGRGIAPGAISIVSSAIFIAIADSHDEEGVVLPRGWGLYR
jgi:hypothetical protein